MVVGQAMIWTRVEFVTDGLKVDRCQGAGADGLSPNGAKPWQWGRFKRGAVEIDVQGADSARVRVAVGSVQARRG